MTKMTYGEQLKHPFWQRKRLQVLEAAAWGCESCGDKGSTLHVHHRRYVKGRMAWEYEDHELQALCQACHGEQHEQRELLDRLLLSEGAELPNVIGLLAGYLDTQMLLHEDLQSDCRALGGPYFIEGQIAALMSRVNWLRAGEALVGLLGGDEGLERLNPAERQAMIFLLSQPEPARDL
jgi:hypothetical protein